MADYPTYERFGITYQNCEKNLKWRIVCAGVQRLCEEQGLNEEDVTLWIDWQSSTPHRSSNPRTSRSAPLEVLGALVGLHAGARIPPLHFGVCLLYTSPSPRD